MWTILTNRIPINRTRDCILGRASKHHTVLVELIARIGFRIGTFNRLDFSHGTELGMGVATAALHGDLFHRISSAFVIGKRSNNYILRLLGLGDLYFLLKR